MRAADDFRVGDRVYVHDDGFFSHIRVGEIRTVEAVCLEDIEVAGANSGYPKKYFYRVLEQGETIPTGSVTRSVYTNGLGKEIVWHYDFGLVDVHPLRVIISTPTPDPKLLEKQKIQERIKQAQAELAAAERELEAL